MWFFLEKKGTDCKIRNNLRFLILIDIYFLFTMFHTYAHFEAGYLSRHRKGKPRRDYHLRGKLVA